MNQIENKITKEMDVTSLINLFKKRLWLLVLITMIFSAVGLIFIAFTSMSPKYQSSTNIIIDADAEYRNTLQVVIKDPTVLETVIRKLGLNKTSEALAKQVGVESIEDTQVVKISVTDTNPELAANIANMTAQVFIGKVPGIVDINGIQVLSEAKVSTKPVQTNSVKILLVATLLGLVTGMAFIFIMDYLNDSLRSERDIESRLGIQVLGSVPKVKQRRRKKRKNTMNELNLGGEGIGIR